jgi:hypothetical protein
MSERKPALRPTEPATLVVAAVAAAAVAWLLISNFYQRMPPLGWPPVILFGGLAAFEAVIARNTWSRVHDRGPATLRLGPDDAREPVEPLTVARFAVLAKASSLAGALFVGFHAGLLPWLIIEAARLPDAAADLPPVIGGLVTSAALVAAALWLERACRIPERRDEDEESPRPVDETDQDR